jgi:conjugal transfer pilus assembly protein TraD
VARDADTRWRSAYEVYPALAWLAVVVLGIRAAVAHSLPADVPTATWLIGGTLGVWRVAQALQVWRHRMALEPRALDWISTEEVYQKMLAKPGQVWLGWGFQWSRIHAQRLYDLEQADLARLRVPGVRLWRYLTGRGNVGKGSAHLHGVEPVERDVYVSLSDLQGHLFVPAATGTIKTQLLKLLVVQAIRRTPKEAVVVLDPKGDQELLELMRAECRLVGREQEFAFFHRAFPRESVRLDPLATWSHTTEVASRIAALIPSESGNDPWSAFGWRVLDVVVAGCVAAHGARPTLKTIRRYVEGGVDQLLHTTLVKFFEAQGVDWRAGIEPHLRNAARSKRPSPTTPAETVALVSLYKSEHQQSQSSSPVDGLISMYEHNREHSQKMLASLIPILTMLTSGDLAGLLSPDRDDPLDTRPILTASSIADSGAVVYIGPDALSDAVVAYAILSIYMADSAAHAGARFNLGISEPRVSFFWDEANESINRPSIQILNKARKAGYTVVFLSQTVADFIAKLGSDALARQALGNANSILVGRIKDGLTAEYVLESFGQTIISSAQVQHGTSTVSGGEPINFSGSYGTRDTDTAADLVTQEALGRLPDLEYFASFSGGQLVKGRIPLVRSGAERSTARRAWPWARGRRGNRTP